MEKMIVILILTLKNLIRLAVRVNKKKMKERRKIGTTRKI